MNRLQLSVTSIWAALFVAACSGESSSGPGNTGQGGAGVGGSDQTGGSSNPGGNTSVGGATTGPGSSSAGGSASTGGRSGTGGTAAGELGGTTASSATGGKSSTGGTSGVLTGTGGKSSSTGGVSGDGGKSSTGGGSAGPTEPIVVTSAQNNYWKSAAATTSTGTADLTVNDSSASQTWEGFGGSFNELGWKYLTTSALQQEAIDLLFGEEGAHFVMARIPMGASDYAESRYTLDDTGEDVTPNSGETNRPPADTSLNSFSIERDKQKLIPYVKAAITKYPNIRLWASPWTPPVWMKTGYKKDSGAPSGGNATKPSYFDGGSMKSDSATLNALAQYFVKFIKAYDGEGIKIETVAPQNEPNYDQNYPSCKWEAGTFTSFVKALGTALSGAGLDTKIMLGTMSNTSGDPSIVTSVMGDATAKGLVKSIGLQWGMVGNASSYKQYGLPMWVSEHKCGNYPWETSTYKQTAPNDHAYGVETWGLIKDAIKAGVTGYNAWNMVLDKVGLGNDTSRHWAQNALLVVDGGKITQTPAYYVFRHLSQYVAAGAKVVGTSNNDSLAFKNPDGSVVAVVFSSSGKSNYVVAVGSKKVQFNMPANGWATVVIP